MGSLTRLYITRRNVVLCFNLFICLLMMFGRMGQTAISWNLDRLHSGREPPAQGTAWADNTSASTDARTSPPFARKRRLHSAAKAPNELQTLATALTTLLRWHRELVGKEM